MSTVSEQVFELYFEKAIRSAQSKGVALEDAENIVSEALMSVIEAGEQTSIEEAKQILFGKVKYAVLRHRRSESNRASIEAFSDDTPYSWDEIVSGDVSDVPLFTPQEVARREEWKRIKADPVKYAEHKRRNREWLQRNRDKANKMNRDYYAKHRERILASQKHRERKERFVHRCERC